MDIQELFFLHFGLDIIISTEGNKIYNQYGLNNISSSQVSGDVWFKWLVEWLNNVSAQINVSGFSWPSQSKVAAAALVSYSQMTMLKAGRKWTCSPSYAALSFH